MRVFVKICGITSLEAARACEVSGANAIGFVFAPSSRRITDTAACKINRMVSGPMARVGVFADEKPKEVIRIAEKVGLTHVQLHGDEPPGICQLIRQKGYGVLKAFRVGSKEDLTAPNAYDVDFLVLDAFVPGVKGGTGTRLNLELLDGFKPQTPIIIAGGLDESNVGQVLNHAMPFGVDVSSGVEINGRKSPGLIRRFISAVRQAERALGM